MVLADNARMDWIYVRIYYFALSSPSKNDAGDVAAMFLGGFVALHAITFAYILKRLTGLGIRSSYETVVIVVSCIVSMAFSFYVYETKGRGPELIRRARDNGVVPRPLVGMLIILETVFLPIWAIPLLQFLHR